MKQVMRGEENNSLKLPMLFPLEQKLEDKTNQVQRRKDPILDNENYKWKNKLQLVEEENTILHALVVLWLA